MFKIKYSSGLKGQVSISGSKNAALPIVAANFIADNKVELTNLPDIKDLKMLSEIATKSLQESNGYLDLSYPEVSKIRASILLIPLGLVKYGKVVFCGSGGCKIGKRPLGTFDDALVQAGVKVTDDKLKTYELVSKSNKKIVLQEFSVTATESLITFLAFSQNFDTEVEIHQVAIEPHVINLIDYLRLIGADIIINYDHSITIKRSEIKIPDTQFKIIGDYIQAGTYFAIGAGADNSELIIKDFQVKDLESVFNFAKKIGVNFQIIDENSVKVNSYNKENYKAAKLQTMIFPGFATDLQSLFGTLLTQTKGISKIFETLFEGRFAYLAELENLGANIEILNPHQAIIIGPSKLRGGYVATTDLRGGGAMILAGIMAEGETYITNEDIILRGYDNIEENLKNIGVNIERVQ
ncbi:MAG: UDP-N-acetylglucosamine 1-carboxyvinyltransferase [Candidatus Absconditabacteria bacterium]